VTKLIDHHGGWVPQRPDHRDRYYHLEETILTAAKLPARRDLYPGVPGAWDQGQEGSCTAHGSLKTASVTLLKEGISLPGQPAGGAPFARQAQYFWTRDLEGTAGQDAGAMVRDAVKVIATKGMAPETDYPYSEPLTRRPPASVEAAAAPNVALKYQSVVVGGPGSPMRTAIANGLAIVFGFSVPESFEQYDAANEVYPLPQPDDQIIGGHCVCITGYDFSCKDHPTPYFICDNSWGTGWGGTWGGSGSDGGRFAMEWDWFDQDRGLASDLWVIQQVK